MPANIRSYTVKNAYNGFVSSSFWSTLRSQSIISCRFASSAVFASSTYRTKNLQHIRSMNNDAGTQFEQMHVILTRSRYRMRQLNRETPWFYSIAKWVVSSPPEMIIAGNLESTVICVNRIRITYGRVQCAEITTHFCQMIHIVTALRLHHSQPSVQRHASGCLERKAGQVVHEIGRHFSLVVAHETHAGDKFPRYLVHGRHIHANDFRRQQQRIDHLSQCVPIFTLIADQPAHALEQLRSQFLAIVVERLDESAYRSAALRCIDELEMSRIRCENYVRFAQHARQFGQRSVLVAQEPLQAQRVCVVHRAARQQIAQQLKLARSGNLVERTGTVPARRKGVRCGSRFRCNGMWAKCTQPVIACGLMEPPKRRYHFYERAHFKWQSK